MTTPDNVKNNVKQMIILMNERTKKFRGEFIKLIKNNKIVVFIFIFILFSVSVSYAFTPKIRNYIVRRTLSNYTSKQSLDSVYKVMTDNKILDIDNNINTHTLYGKSSKKKKLWLTLSDFYIASSAKSYLLMNKYYDYCSYDSIRYILDAGARFIELDIFRKGLNDFENEPIVTNGIELGEWKLCLNTLCLDKCLDIIDKYAFDTKLNPANENPLILYLNIHIGAKIIKDNNLKEKYGDYRFYNKVADMIHNSIKSKYILGPEYSQYGKGYTHNKPLSPIHLSNINIFKSKLIIMSNVMGANSNLSEYINMVCPRDIKIKAPTINNLTNNEANGVYNVNATQNVNKNKLLYIHDGSKKNGLDNYKSGKCFNLGAQLISMYYQNNDLNFQDYLNKNWAKNTLYGNIDTLEYNFMKCSFILKPSKLRNSFDDIIQYTHIQTTKDKARDANQTAGNPYSVKCFTEAGHG